jgi:hypothetical protein
VNTTWSKPYHGVMHSQTNGKRSYATITDRGSFADLALNAYGGRPFHPITEQHDTIEQAKASAEKWLEAQH